MASIKDEGVCIRHWDWSETSQTVSLLSREHGVIRGLAKGARREKGSFSGGIELLTRGELVCVIKSGGAMSTLTAWDLRETFPRLRRSLGAYYAAVYMADLAGHFLREGDPHPVVYDELVEGLRGLASGGAGDPALLRFQWALLSDCGYEPELARDVRTNQALQEAPTYAFAPGLGGLVAAQRDDVFTWRVRAETVDLLRDVARRAELGAEDAVIARANRLLGAYVREILGKEPPSMGVAILGGDGAGPERSPD